MWYLTSRGTLVNLDTGSQIQPFSDVDGAGVNAWFVVLVPPHAPAGGTLSPVIERAQSADHAREMIRGLAQTFQREGLLMNNGVRETAAT